MTASDLDELTELVDQVVKAGESGDKKLFLERDFAFHRLCWELSGNRFLAETLERLMAPLFVFVVIASGAPLTANMGREHYEIIRALRELKGKAFTSVVYKTLNGFASRWLAVTGTRRLLTRTQINNVTAGRARRENPFFMRDLPGGRPQSGRLPSRTRVRVLRPWWP